MANHFACIGLNVGTEAQFNDARRRMAAAAEREAEPGGERWLWRDPSMAEFAMFVVDGAVYCAKPTLSGTTATTIRNAVAIPDPGGCEYCALAQVDVGHERHGVGPAVEPRA